MKNQACRNCGFVGEGLKVIQGYFFVELLLWVMFIVPGIAYSIWRYLGPKNVCPKCGLAAMVPGDSPVGQAIIRKWNETVTTETGGIQWHTK